MKNFFHNMFAKAAMCNHENIFSLLDINRNAAFVDLGCDDGLLTKLLAKKIHTDHIYGADLLDSRLKKAKQRGVNTKKFDLNGKFPYSNNTFDVVHANQVIEHIHDTDKFLLEIFRVLKPNGYAIISTENASSWCNVLASLFGWQIFSLTNFSSFRAGIGNPLAIHRADDPTIKTWQHVRIYNIYGLKEYFEIAGFRVEKILGAGYFPFPAFFGRLDTTHSHFITYKIRKSNR